MRNRSPIDPQLRQFLDEQAANAPDFSSMAGPERTAAHRAALPRALASRDSIPGLPNAVRTRDLVIANDRPARLYTPPTGIAGPRPLLVYLHGGGWVAGSLDTVDPFCCLLSDAADVPILSVDYRQPPEHAFPAALEDSVAAVTWAVEHAAELGADPRRVALGGDSAGGNLTAAAANRLAARGASPVVAQLLLFPVLDHFSAQHPSYEENATGYGLSAESMRWFWGQYTQGHDPNDPDLSPLRIQQLPALPPTLVTTAEYDVLRDEGIAYAEKLRAAGNAVTHLHAPEMHHDFPVSPATVARFPQCLTTLNEIAGWLRAMLHTPLAGSLQAPR
jgi:acetyl esterase